MVFYFCFTDIVVFSVPFCCYVFHQSLHYLGTGNFNNKIYLKNRPFKLQGAGGYVFFSDNDETRVRILFLFVTQSANFSVLPFQM
jgi:hypothetical protein